MKLVVVGERETSSVGNFIGKIQTKIDINTETHTLIKPKFLNY